MKKRGHKQTESNNIKPILFAGFIILLLSSLLIISKQELLGISGKISKQIKPFECPEIAIEDRIDIPKKEKIAQGAKLVDDKSTEITNIVRKSSFNDARLKDLISSRKNLLISTMRNNPDLAISSILLREERDIIEKITKNCVEKIAMVEGTLDITHADFFDQGITKELYTLITKDRKKIAIHPAFGLTKAVKSGNKIKVKGLKIGENDILFDGRYSTSKPNGDFGGYDVLSAINPSVIGEQNTIVALVNFLDTSPIPDITAESINNLVFTETNNYYLENSYNKINLKGETLGWHDLAIQHSCGVDAVTQATIDAIDPLVDFTAITYLVIIAPFNCPWGGIAMVGGREFNSQEGIVRISTSMIQAITMGVIAHELGHNFLNWHANFINCDQSSIEDYGCTHIEYGDVYSVMGSSRESGHYNAIHKERTGWFTSQNIQTVVENGIFSIEPIETATNGLKSIKIQRKLNDYLYFEYRQPIGFDSGLDYIYDRATGYNGPSNVFEGSLLHIIQPTGPTSYIIDPNPPAYIPYPALLPGEVFFDPASGARIGLVSKTPTELTLDVTLGKTDFTPPVVAITSPSGGGVFRDIIDIVATASDADGIDHLEFFYRKGKNTVRIGTDTTAPYEIQFDTRQAPNGVIYLFARAYDLTGIPFDANGNSADSTMVGITLDNRGEFNPPNIEITSPTENQYILNPVTVEVTVTDESGINRVEFYKDYDASSHSFVDTTSPYSTVIDFTLQPTSSTTSTSVSTISTTSVLTTSTTGTSTIPAGYTVITFRQGENSYLDSSDTYISSDHPVTSRSQDAVIGLRNGIHIGLLSFDISQVPDNANIVDAKLMLKKYLTNPNSVLIGLYRLTTPGIVIDTATWNTKDGVNSWAAGSFSTADYNAEALAFYPLEESITVFDMSGNVLTSHIQNQLVSNNLEFALLSHASSGIHQNIWSSNTLFATDRPKLFIGYTLEPLEPLAPVTSTTITTTSTTSAQSKIQTQITTSTIISKFRQGENGYTGSSDTHLYSVQPATSWSKNNVIATRGNVYIGLLSFDTSQVPDNANIVDAKLMLTYNLNNPSTTIGLHQLTTPGVVIDSATWNTKDGLNSWVAGPFSTADYDTETLAVYTSEAIVNTYINISGERLTSYIQNQLVSDKVEFALINQFDIQHNFYSIDSSFIPTRPALFIAYTLPLNGPHVIYIKAVDIFGNMGMNSVNVIVDTLSPVVFISQPKNNANVGGLVNIAATATDNNAINRVEFYRDSDTLIGVDNIYPYSIAWDSVTSGDGQHRLYAKAYDAAGNIATSGAITVNVIGGGGGGGGGKFII